MKHKLPRILISFFTEIGPKIVKKIETHTIKFDNYLEQCDTIQPDNPVSINELKDGFFSLQINKSYGYDVISFNVVKLCFNSLNKPLLHIFNLSIQKGVFPDELKIARVTPIYKNNDEKTKTDFGNYRPISVLACFSKILQGIAYNQLYEHLNSNNIIYKKQFGFQKGHSTEHAILQLVVQISNSFEKNLLTLGAFNDLSKAFATADHD